MVLNLCLPHFHTTAQCNKLCADGYDVANLLAADPVVRRRGFKLEYFLRPPVQVTLQFDFQVEVSRVDLELWPWAMDRGQACKKKVEISTSSAPSAPQGQEGDGDEAGRREPDFTLVGRCELMDETLVCFSHPCLQPRPPFPSAPPPPAPACRREALWSRGPLSLGAVTRLRVAIPFGGGGGSALGLKALAVWGQPARGCPAAQVERVRAAHRASQPRTMPPPGLLLPSADQTLSSSETTPRLPSVPEEFLDPITQEVMVLPMLLPGGTSVDHSTLEEYRRREATWGRPPNDPFTGVPFTAASQPFPNPLLKSRIDRFVLRAGAGLREGALGRLGEKPQASRLLDPKRDESRGPAGSAVTTDKHLARGPAGFAVTTDKHLARGPAGSGVTTDKHLTRGPAGSAVTTDKHLTRALNGGVDRKSRRQDYSGKSRRSVQPESAQDGSAHHDRQQQPEPKRPRMDTDSAPGSVCHEQRLSDSLDEALFSALQGRPSFTSCSNRHTSTTDTQDSTDTPGEDRCCSCSCSLSTYAARPAVYRLPCDHLLCRPCLHAVAPASARVQCPACRTCHARGDVTRVHH